VKRQTIETVGKTDDGDRSWLAIPATDSDRLKGSPLVLRGKRADIFPEHDGKRLHQREKLSHSSIIVDGCEFVELTYFHRSIQGRLANALCRLPGRAQRPMQKPSEKTEV
jgi:hypothetical protein